jgi:hypothetical protein
MMAILAATTAGLMTSACVGGFDPQDQATADTTGTTPGATSALPSTAKPLFDANVAQTLTARCGGPACHSAPGTSPPKFMGNGQGDLYTVVIGFSDILFGGNFNKANAQVLTKVAAGHYGVTYSAAQSQAIGDWLDAERAARANQSPTVSPQRQLLSVWSGCMDLTDFNANGGVSDAWARKGSNGGTCETCHINAQGWLATRENERAFTVHTTQISSLNNKPYLEYLFTVDTTTDPANPKVVINRGILDRAASGAGQHPKFDVVSDPNDPNDPYVELQAFYDKTLARLNAGTCGPPRLAPN